MAITFITCKTAEKSGNPDKEFLDKDYIIRKQYEGNLFKMPKLTLKNVRVYFPMHWQNKIHRSINLVLSSLLIKHFFNIESQNTQNDNGHFTT